MADTNLKSGDGGEEDQEESEYSYVYETDSEYSYYTDSEEEGEGEPAQGNNETEEHSERTVGIKSDHENNVVVSSNSEEDEEDENEALRRQKQQLERFKPKIPDYVTSPEPCAFSDDPSTWIAWMEAQVNKEKTRRMELIMKEEVEEDEDEEKEVEANIESSPMSPSRDIKQTESPDSPMDCNNVHTCDDSMGDTSNAEDDTKMQIDESSNDQETMIVDTEAQVASVEDKCDNLNEDEEESEWEWEYEDEDAEEVEVSVSVNLNNPCEESSVENDSHVKDCHLNEIVEECEENITDNSAENHPAEEGNAEKQETVRLSLDKQMSLPAENKRRELVPKDMQEKMDFIRKKKAEAACGQRAVSGENPTNNSAPSSLLDEETKRKLAFIKERKSGGTLPRPSSSDDVETKHDPNDPLDPETRRKLEFVRKNKKKQQENESGQQSPAPGAPPPLLRAQSNPEGSKAATGGRPTSFAEQYGDESKMDDMLARIKTLREERKQILQDMNAIKTAFNGGGGGAPSSSGAADDDGIETGESSPCTPGECPPALLGRNARRSIDSGIGTKSLTSSGSPTEELDAISEKGIAAGAANPGKKKISKEEKEHSEGVFHCFICGENLGKMTKGTVMHMGLEDGEPVCPDALYLTDESKEKILTIASTRMFTYEAKFELLDTMELETWDLEYDIPTGDLMDKVDAFLQDVEVQKQRDAEKFEAMRSGAIDEIFMEEFKELLSEKCSAPSRHTERTDVTDPAAHKNNECDRGSEPALAAAAGGARNHGSEHPPARPPPPAPAPPPPPPPSTASIPEKPSTPAFNNVLKSIREADLKQLKHTEVSNNSEIEVGQVIHKHIAPRVFTRDIRSLVKDITKDDHKKKLKKVKTNDKSAPFIPDDVEIYFYGGQNANKAAPPPPLSKIKEEYNPCKKR